MASVFDYGIIVSEFELQSGNYFHFLTNTFDNSLISKQWVKYNNFSSSTRMALTFNNPQRLICHQIKNSNQINGQGNLHVIFVLYNTHRRHTNKWWKFIHEKIITSTFVNRGLHMWGYVFKYVQISKQKCVNSVYFYLCVFVYKKR